MEDVGCFVGRREVVGGREETKNTNFEFCNYVIKILIWIRKIYKVIYSYIKISKVWFRQ